MAMIRDTSYSHWQGTLLERKLPWWPITRTGIGLTFRKKHFKFLFSFAFLPAVFFLVGIYISERLEDFKFMVKGSQNFITVNPAYFKNYMTNDFILFWMIMLMVFSGAGLIADDLKHNALPIYFSRPIRKWDYLLGKAAVIFFFILLLTLVPGLVFYVMKIIFSGSFAFVAEFPWLLLSIIGYSLLLTVFFAFYTLLMSALSKNRRYVTILIFAVYLISDNLSGITNGIFHNPYFGLLSLKGVLQQAGAVIFGQRLPYDYPGYWAFAVIVGICVLSGFILRRRIREVEVIR